MLAFDWSVNLGNFLTIGSTVAATIFYFGRYKKELEVMQRDLTEIKEQLHEARRSDSTTASTIAVLQQRVITLESEIQRMRDNIHRLANVAQVELLRRGDGD